jgi:nucleotide-binding universal stress UspA family protein
VHELLFGSTAERLLYRTPVPLLVVKRTPRSDYRVGLAATDFSAASSAAVRTARKLLPALELTLYHAAEALDEGFAFRGGLDEAGRAEIRAQAIASARAELDCFAQGCSESQLDKRVEYGYPMAMIEDAVQRDAVDLLVLGKRGRSALEQWAVGSVTAHLARSVACDVLIVPPQEELSRDQPSAASG